MIGVWVARPSAHGAKSHGPAQRNVSRFVALNCFWAVPRFVGVNMAVQDSKRRVSQLVREMVAGDLEIARREVANGKNAV
jgi:hypothetical protein